MIADMLVRTAFSAGFGLVVAVGSGCGGEDPGEDTGASASGDTTAGPTSSSGSDSDPSDPDDGGPASTDSGSGDSGEDTVGGSTSSGDAADSSGGDAELPADVLDLADWKLTLPIGSREAPDEPLEIFQPELATYSIDPWFRLDDTGTGVLFQANAGGVTTDNSGYPRSELREMQNGGMDNADWSTTVGVHTMTITQAITHLPEAKPHVVAGQIHDSEDDVVMIRLEDTHLFVEGGGEELGDLEPDYVLGTPFTVQLRAADGVIDVYYEDMGTPAVSVIRDAEGCYFKAGAYTQSNLEQGDDEAAYGEVVITELVVTHE